MVKFQRRKPHEPWVTVETSRVEDANHVSATLDILEIHFKDFQLRAINDKNQLLETR